MPKKIFVKNKGFEFVNSKEDPKYRAALGLLYDWRIVGNNPSIRLSSTKTLWYELPPCLSRFYGYQKDEFTSKLIEAVDYQNLIAGQRRYLKLRNEELGYDQRWLIDSLKRISKLHSDMTNAPYVVSLYTDNAEAPSVRDQTIVLSDRTNSDFAVRVIKVPKSYLKTVAKAGFSLIRDRFDAYPLSVKLYETAKDGTEIYTCTWYEQREIGQPRIFEGYLAKYVYNDKIFTAVSEKKLGARQKVKLRLARWKAGLNKKEEKPQEVTINELGYVSEEEIFKALITELDMPDYCEPSYDDLYEFLTENTQPLCINWTARMYSKWLFVQLIQQAAEKNPKLTVNISYKA